MSQKNRPPMVVAMERVSQITALGGEMVLPAVAGYFLDQRWGTSPWLIISGGILGLSISFWHLYQLSVQSAKKAEEEKKRRSQ